MALPKQQHVVRDTEGKPVIPEYVQEFFLSEAVRSQDKNELQITFALDSRSSVGNNADIQIEYGLTNRLQLNSEMPYGITATERAEIPARWSSTGAGLRYQVIQSDRPFAFSIGMAFGLPIESNSELSYQPIVLAAKTFRKLQLHASFVADVEKHEPSFEYNVRLPDATPLVSHDGVQRQASRRPFLRFRYSPG